MAFHPITILYRPARLLVVTTPKVGSTTLFSAFLTLAGFGAEAHDPRKFLRTPDNTEKVQAEGLTIQHRPVKEIEEMRRDLTDYKFAVVMRDPVHRLVSGYINKTNRYCKRYSKTTYVYGKLRQLLRGPAKWSDINCGNEYMRRSLSLENFVSGLERHGTEWDSHFAGQSQVVGLDMVNYDRLLRLDELDHALPRLLDDCGVEAETMSRLATLPRLNRAPGSADLAGSISPDLVARIKQLYLSDFQYFNGDLKS